MTEAKPLSAEEIAELDTKDANLFTRRVLATIEQRDEQIVKLRGEAEHLQRERDRLYRWGEKWHEAAQSALEGAEIGEASAAKMRAALENIRGQLGSCRIQRAPSDDKIIAEHIDSCYDAAREALTAKERKS